ncbi:MAG: leucine-rich repeat domain-containing protein [Clostridia bacterium]|nr:leucine-rich repeat domain-containing protein [Clostridia bacterium]
MKRILSAALALIFALLGTFAALPASAKTQTRYSAPPGYNNNDYQKLVAFLEQKDGSGVKNGKKLNSGYSPTDPSTWTGITWYGGMVSSIEAVGKGLVGPLDLSGCSYLQNLECGDNGITSLNVSDCHGLSFLSCYDNLMTGLMAARYYSLGMVLCGGNKLTSISFPDSTDLYRLSCMENELTSLDLRPNFMLLELYCYENKLTSIDVSACTQLETLNCGMNRLTSLNVSNCPRLDSLSCESNRIKSLDLSRNPLLFFDSVTAEGNGTIAITNIGGYTANRPLAQADSGASFLGWYSESGTFLSSYVDLYPESETRVIALFTGGSISIRGDANHDGRVDTEDALIVLRAAMGISGDADSLISNCDMDGNGRLDTTDALMILRLALGIG